MNLITFAEPITIAFKKSAGGSQMTFEAGRDYLIANAQLERVLRDEQVQKRSYKISRADSRIRNFCVTTRNGARERLLLFNGSGGYGDQIMTWPIAKILTQLGYDVHILTDPGNNVCWWNFPWIKSVMTIPLLWEQVKLFDHFCPFEAVVNMDEHQDQGHPVDMMLAKIGIDPEKIPAEQKVVRPNFTFSELGALQTFVAGGKKIGLYQLSSANPVRCLPPSDSVFMLSKVAEAFPDIHWLCLYDEFVPKEYADLLKCRTCQGSGEITATAASGTSDGSEKVAPKATCKTCNGGKFIAKNIQPFTAPNLRELWALTEHATVVVSPDSMMSHVAGVFGTPCVGLWGPMSPESRMKYYTNHHPIHHREFCPHSPCFCYSSTFPKYCPQRPSTRNVCDVLAGVSPAEVIELVGKVRRR
jgi:Glycosyltransferase family 9 (heptosyltransferase)